MRQESVKVELLVNPFCFEETHLCNQLVRISW